MENSSQTQLFRCLTLYLLWSFSYFLSNLIAYVSKSLSCGSEYGVIYFSIWVKIIVLID